MKPLLVFLTIILLGCAESQSGKIEIAGNVNALPVLKITIVNKNSKVVQIADLNGRFPGYLNLYLDGANYRIRDFFVAKNMYTTSSLIDVQPLAKGEGIVYIVDLSSFVGDDLSLKNRSWVNAYLQASNVEIRAICDRADSPLWISKVRFHKAAPSLVKSNNPNSSP